MSHAAPSDHGRRLVVVGSINVDISVIVEHFARAGETVLATSALRGIGGKGANQALAAVGDGADVHMVARVGADPQGPAARAALADAGVDVSGIAVDGDEMTGMALIVVDESGENQIVVVSGANERVDAAAVSSAGVRAGDVVLAQGEIPRDTVVAAASRAREVGARFVLNLAPVIELDAVTLSTSDPLVVNQHEARALGAGPADEADTAEWQGFARSLLSTAASVVITLGARGAVYAEAGADGAVPAVTTSVVDTTGAGDAFTGALAAALARGEGLSAATAAGARCAARAVSVRGANAVVL